MRRASIKNGHFVELLNHVIKELGILHISADYIFLSIQFERDKILFSFVHQNNFLIVSFFFHFVAINQKFCSTSFYLWV